MVLVGFAVLLVASSMALVGHFASRLPHQAFDWELASVFGTAVGTTALAIATGALAYTTSGDVRATWAMAEIATKDQEARDRPFIVITKWESHFEPAPADPDVSGFLPITLRNIGLGPAEHLTIEARYVTDPTKAMIHPALANAIMPGEEVKRTLVVKFHGPTPDDAQYGAFEWRGTYFGRLGREYELEFAPHGHGGGVGLKWSSLDAPAVAAEGVEST